MNTNNYGINMNLSLVFNDEGCELGLHYQDSEGLDVSTEVQAEDIESGLDQLLTEVILAAAKMMDTPEETQEEQIKRLEEELQSTKVDNQILEQRIQHLMSDKQEHKCTCKAEKEVVDIDNIKELLEKFLF